MHSPALSKSSRAQAIVEFALVLPVLVLLLAGVVDLGNAFQTYIGLTNAAREGATYGANPTDGATILATINFNACSVAKTALPNGLPNAQPICAVTYPGVAGDNSCPSVSRLARCPIRVTISYSITPLLGSVLGFNSFDVSTSVNMMVLQ